MTTDMELFESDLQDEELSGLQYARRHGLSIDYTTETLHLGNITQSSDDTIDQDSWNPSAIAVINATSELIRERLAVNKDTALLLRAVQLLQEAPVTDVTTTDRRKWKLDLKQELPVLPTDYELDLLAFGNADLPNLRDSRLPSELNNEESDEGLQWPSKYFDFPAQCDSNARAEKLAITKEVLLYLQNAIRDDYMPENLDDNIASGRTYKPNIVTRPLTPPLLSLSPPLTPYVPSSPGNRLPLASDDSDGIALETKALEHQIMAADSLKRNDSDSGDSMLLDIINPPQSSPPPKDRIMPILKRKADHLKVEGPLTPPMFSSSPLKKFKSVSFAEIIHRYIPDTLATRDAPSDDGGDSVINFDEYDDLLRDIEPVAAQAKRKVENEQLSNADTTARVNVPEVDFSQPIAPWKEYSLGVGGRQRPEQTELDAQMRFLLRIKREDPKTTSSCHGLSALERTLRWNIFTTNISSIKVDEKLHGETVMNDFLADVTSNNIATTSSLIWKREGLRILDEGDVEVEIETEMFEDKRDMDSLVRKRKLKIAEEVAEVAEVHQKRMVPQILLCAKRTQPQVPLESHHWKGGLLAAPVVTKFQSRPSDLDQQATESHHKQKHSLADSGNDLMFGGFSATTALRKFMQTRGKPAVPEIIDPHIVHFPKITPAPVRNTLQSQCREPAPKTSVNTAPEMSTQPPTIDPPKQPPSLPAVPEVLAPSSFIVSSTLLQQRSLMKQVYELYSSAEILYRDYTLPHSAAKEADVLISPSTGLIFTTLQQIKQKALPGQRDRSPVKERMEVLQTRYERLVVIISEGLSREMEQRGSTRPDDPRDEEALKRFEAFAESLDAEVLVRFARGGEQALARFIVIAMAEYGLPHGSLDIGDIKPLAVETSWEVFLRRAGLNPFAAQVIVASLKKPSEVQVPMASSSPTSSESQRTIAVSGLTAFLMTSEEDRIRHFQALLGGSRILARVSRVLDQRWISAAHGFRM